jgi:hypothetical protein
MNPDTLFLNPSLQRAAEFSGAAGSFPLPEPGLITNSYPIQRNRIVKTLKFVNNPG